MLRHNSVFLHVLDVEIVFEYRLEVGAQAAVCVQGFEILNNAIINVLFHELLIQGQLVESDQFSPIVQKVAGESKHSIILFSFDWLISDFKQSFGVEEAIRVLGVFEIMLDDFVIIRGHGSEILNLFGLGR